MEKCPYCGREVADTDVVCKYCFAGLPAKKEPEKPKKAMKKPNEKE